MPRFETPTPVPIVVDIVGDVRITASDRSDTMIGVRPRDPAQPADVKAAEQTRVEHSDSGVQVRTPKQWRPFGATGSIDLTVEVPTGCDVVATTALGDIRADGELGRCRFRTSMGNVRLDHTGPLDVTTAFGRVEVERVAGDLSATTGSGEVRVLGIDGAATIRNSNGTTTVGDVGGELRVRSANGDVFVDRAAGSVTARTANGDIRVAEVRRGVTDLQTAAGELEVGVRRGTAVWLDVTTRFGTVHRALDDAGEPGPGDPTVEVRARTSVGDIIIGRSRYDDPAPPAGADVEGARP